jgi:hypothetical protein
VGRMGKEIDFVLISEINERKETTKTTSIK